MTQFTGWLQDEFGKTEKESYWDSPSSIAISIGEDILTAWAIADGIYFANLLGKAAMKKMALREAAQLEAKNAAKLAFSGGRAGENYLAALVGGTRNTELAPNRWTHRKPL